MKKITLLLLAFIAGFGVFAQQTISFETAEGFTLGDINGQSGWVSTGDGSGGFVTNQVISDEQSTDGTQSFKITTESAFGPQSNPVIGGFYTYPSPVDYTSAVISYDIYIDEVPDANDYLFGVIGEDPLGDPGFVFLVVFNFENNIRVADDAGNFTNIGTWVTDTWYNVRVEITGSSAEYFIDDVSVATYNLLNNYDILSARFVHDNFGGNAYFDNFRTNDEPLSTFDFSATNFNYFVDNNNYLNLSADQQLDNVSLHNLLGQQVLSQKLSAQDEQINLNALSSGVYLAKVQIKGATKTFKIMKK